MSAKPISEARTTTLIKAEGLIEPVLTDAMLNDTDPATVARLTALVDSDVLDETLLRVKLWRADGTILVSDEDRLVGQQFALDDEETEAMASGRIEAEVSDLDEPENQYERELGTRLLEVYLPVHTPNGTPLLFEAYYRYDSVQANGTRLWRSFAPIALGALVMLELVQIPLAWSLARRLRMRLQEREALLQHALESSAVERRQIASDLHDGVVQDLSGVAYALSARARLNAGQPDDGTAASWPTPCARASAACARWSSTCTRRTCARRGWPRRCSTSSSAPAGTGFDVDTRHDRRAWRAARARRRGGLPGRPGGPAQRRPARRRDGGAGHRDRRRAAYGADGDRRRRGLRPGHAGGTRGAGPRRPQGAARPGGRRRRHA